MVDSRPPVQSPPPRQSAPPPHQPQPARPAQPSPNSLTQQQGKDSDRPLQKDIDEQRKRGASSSKNWYREEGSVIGEDPASIDFVGSYPWTNVGEPGENRDDDTPITPPAWRAEEEQETIAEEQRRKSEMDARAARKVADRRQDDQLEKDYPSSPASAFRTQREKDAENDRARDSVHGMNRPAPVNRPHVPAE
jgi:hypothetical protein